MKKFLYVSIICGFCFIGAGLVTAQLVPILQNSEKVIPPKPKNYIKPLTKAEILLTEKPEIIEELTSGELIKFKEEYNQNEEIINQLKAIQTRLISIEKNTRNGK